MADIASKEFLTSIFIGLLFTSIFYGGTIGQSAWYFSLYRRGSKWHYLLVATLLLLDTAHVIVFSVAAYYVFLSWLNPLGALDTTTWSLPTTIAITYALTFIVQCFFILRIWTLSQKNKAIIACITILVMVQIASGMCTFILLRIEPKILFDSINEINLVAQETRSPIFNITTRTKIAAAIELSSSLVADLAITATLVFYLYRGRSVTKFAFAANSVINRLTCFALSTGLLTSLVALVNLVLFLSSPNSFSWLALQIVSSKLYVNSLLATLNSRRSERDLRSSLYNSTPPPMASRLSMKLDHEAEPRGSNEDGQEPRHDRGLREYDLNLDYDRDLLPPSPQINRTARDVVQARRELLGSGDMRHIIDIPIPSGSISPTPVSPPRVSSMKRTTSGHRVSQGMLTPDPAPIAVPPNAWLLPSLSPKRRESRHSTRSDSTPSVHSSHLTVRTYNTGTFTVASHTSHALPPQPPLFPGDGFANLSIIASYESGARGPGVLRIPGINARASVTSSATGGPTSSGIRPAHKNLPIGRSYPQPQHPPRTTRSARSGKAVTSLPHIANLKFPAEIHRDETVQSRRAASLANLKLSRRAGCVF